MKIKIIVTGKIYTAFMCLRGIYSNDETHLTVDGPRSYDRDEFEIIE